jgi:amino acid adenylation domain-containing protein
MVFHHLLYPHHVGIDIQQLVANFREPFLESVFLEAWRRVVQRHPILRTSFRWQGLEEPLQDVHRQVSLPIIQYDWRALSSHEQQARFTEFLQVDRQRGFDITIAPLMRLTSFRLGSEEHNVVWTFHHLLLDGRSFFLVLQEVFAFYEALRHGQEVQLSLPPPPRAYIDWLTRQDTSRAETFWRQRLTGLHKSAPLVLEPPLDRTLDPTERRGEQGTQLSAQMTSKLRTLAKELQVTLYTLVQGAWALLLSRYSGKDDIVFGVTHLCRWGTVDNADAMVGMFMNTLPVRAHIDPDAQLGSWLQQLRAEQLAMRGYEHTPLSKVHEWSDMPRGASLFDTILVFENFRWTSSLREQQGNWEGRTFRILEQPNYAITVFGSVDEELHLTMTYDRQRCSDTAIARLFVHLRTALESLACGSPHQCVADVSLFPPEERQQILTSWNATQASYPRTSCLHQLFEAQTMRTPHAVAVLCEGQRLTYQELDTRANQLAHGLRKHGIGPEVLVGLCLERSVNMVVGMLGVLKAGGAYVPLDPQSPSQRLAFMAADADIAALVTQEQLRTLLPAYTGPVICLDAQGKDDAEENRETLPVAFSAENLAYVIYTSGSTGTPKGVQISHRSVVNVLSDLRRRLEISHHDTWLATTTLSFDIAVLEFFLPLCIGARVEIATREEIMDGFRLARKLAQSYATVMQATPATWQMLLDVGWNGSPYLTALCGGDTLSHQLADALQSRVAGLWNLYGPTETTIWSTAARVDSTHGPILIGKPLANTQVYILDATLQPVPIGTSGELYISGDGVARGYFNRPELTAEKFLPHPFNATPGARLYKTGDLARFLPDGAIEHLGRCDSQVKVRGFRIELGELESVLTEHPAIRAAVATAYTDSQQEKQLAAYFVTRGAPAPTPSELRAFLATRLPGYMIPATFIRLDALPLTHNGKIDRRALPKPTSLPVDSHSLVRPRTTLEQELLQVWQELLQRDAISIHDNFFDLGGHSLLAVRMLSRLQQRFAQLLPLAALLQDPTIERLAQLLQEEDLQPSPSCVVAIQSCGVHLPFFCVHPAAGSIFQYQKLSRLLGQDQPFYGIESPSLIHGSGLQSSLEALALQYLEQLRRIQSEGPYFLGGYCFGGLVALAIAHLLRAQGQEVALLALFNSWAPGSHLPKLIAWKNRAVNFLRRSRQEKIHRLRQKSRQWLQTLLQLPQHPSDHRELQRFRYVEEQHERLAHEYCPQPYPGRITLFRAQHQPPTITPYPEVQWRHIATGGLEMHTIPGDHFSMFDPPAIETLASLLTESLQRARCLGLRETRQGGSTVLPPSSTDRKPLLFPPQAA